MQEIEALRIVNSYPEYAKEALENVYRGKVFVVLMGGNYSVMAFCKTKKGAEGYVSRNSSSYYDDYSQSMVRTGYDVVELDPSKILDPRTSKQIWYAWLKEVNGQTYMYRNVLLTAEHYKGIDPEVLQYVRGSIEEMGPNGGLTVVDEFEEVEEVEKVETVTPDSEPVQEVKPEQTGKVISFVQAKAKKMTTWTPVQALMLHTVREFTGDDTVVEALARGITPEELFGLAAELAHERMMQEGQEQ